LISLREEKFAYTEFSGKSLRLRRDVQKILEKIAPGPGRNSPFRILYQCQQDLLVPMKTSKRSDAGKNPR
jgi:hypothetical protein